MHCDAPPIRVRALGIVDYESTLAAMSEFTDTRGDATPDEIWLLQHPPVFTLGLNGDRSHILAPGTIPVVQVDRGGQVTYHGPGQLIVYTLINLKRARLGIRELVSGLENAAIAMLAARGIESAARPDAPGVYVEGAKVASVGLRIRRNSSYHGMSVNVTMDLEPFQRINPCGFENLTVTQLSALDASATIETVQAEILKELLAQLGRVAVPM